MSTLPQPGQTIRIWPGTKTEFGCTDFQARWNEGQREFTVASINKNGTPIFEGKFRPRLNLERYTNGDIQWEVVDPLAADIETFATPPHHRDQYPRLAAGAVFTNPDGGTEIMIHMKTGAKRQVQLGSLFIEPGDTTAWPVIRGTGRTEKPESAPPAKPATTAASILEAGLGHMQDRAATYDKPDGERSMQATMDAFYHVSGISMSEEQGWLFMILLKAVRSQQGKFKLDSYEDGAAYFGLAGEAAAQGRK